MQANRLWRLWQDLVLACAPTAFAPGLRYFLTWITGLALNTEEHTITQSLFAVEQTEQWRGAEYFAEYAHWNQALLRARVNRLVEQEVPDRLWHGFHVWAGDDTKVHRDSANVWGTCTFHEYTARCPNRATTVRAHNWLVLGALWPVEHQPACFVTYWGRLYFRKSQLPAGQTFHTKCELWVQLLQQQAVAVSGRHLAVCDGAFALRSVVWPLLHPPAGVPRIEVVTRLRHDARLYRLPPPRHPGQRGRPPVWGRRLPPPRCGGRWPGAWQQGTAYVYGRLRKVQWKEVVCQWRAAGADAPVKAVVAEVEGYRERFTLVSTATELTGLQVVELFCARFRQEDGFRDLKQRLGWEECRAWTQQPIERTTQALFVVLLVMRLLQRKLQEESGEDWWFHPPWNRRKQRPSVLDVERLLLRHREAFRAGLSAWWGIEEKAGGRAPQEVVA